MREGMSLQTRRELLQHLLPQYRQASTVKKKSKLLDAFTAATGYNRKYAIGLLNHTKEVQHSPLRPRPCQYGPEVQHALFLVWHAANRICAKGLMPFLPTLVEALERHEHLHLTEECRSQLLSMSAATADRRLAFPAQTRPARPLHDTGRNAAEAADPGPHLPGVGGDPTWLSGGGPGGPLWHRYRGRLPVFPDAHRYSYRVDGVLAPLISESRSGAGSSPTGTPAVPFSHLGDRY